LSDDPARTRWDAVKIVVDSTGFRLSTEAQWEYACRAESTTNWHFGNDESQLVNYAWYSVNSNSRTRQVGLKLPNAWGLYDMHGNVWEWCWDWWNDGAPFTDPDDLTDPKGATSGSYRVIRGGSWDESAWFSQSAFRTANSPYARGPVFGFRVVRP
jgi:formylglycine-generating enzyme required for sulfatase activity